MSVGQDASAWDPRIQPGAPTDRGGGVCGCGCVGVWVGVCGCVCVGGCVWVCECVWVCGYWSGLPFPPPGDLPNPGTEPTGPETPALVGRFFTTEPPGKPYLKIQMGKPMGIKAMGWSSSQQVGYGGTPNTGFLTLKLCVLGLVTAHL